MKIRLAGAEFFDADRQTDGQADRKTEDRLTDMTKLLVPFRNFANAPKIDLLELIWEGVMDWIDLAQDSDIWQALVNAAMNLRYHKMRGIS